jgi:hypothetical protein
LEVICRELSEGSRQIFVEVNQIVHVDLEEVEFLLGVHLELVSVDELVLLLGLQDEVHELALGFVQGNGLVLLPRTLDVVVHQVLVCVVHLLSFETHLREINIIYTYCAI